MWLFDQKRSTVLLQNKGVINYIVLNYNLFLLKSNQSPQFNSWWYSLAVAANSYKVLVQIWNKVDQCDPLLCQAWQSLWCAHNRQSRSMSTALSSASSISSRIKKRELTCASPPPTAPFLLQLVHADFRKCPHDASLQTTPSSLFVAGIPTYQRVTYPGPRNFLFF